MSCKMIAIGSYLPGNCVSNKKISEYLDTNEEWIVERTGIKQRYFADESVFFMAKNAVDKMLHNYPIDLKSIDLIIATTCTAELAFPSIASKVAHAFNISHVPAFDLNAVCSGFIYAIDVASKFLQSNSFHRVLVISTEKMSSLLTMNDRKVDILFGDGAGAVVIEKSGDSIFYSHIGSDPQYLDILTTEYVDSNAQKINMNGKEVYKYAVNKMTEMAYDTLSKNNTSKDMIDYFVPHQANARIIESVAQKLQFNQDKILTTVDIHANTSSASIPLALDTLREQNILSGKTILSLAVGSGMTYGSALFTFA
ncbi:MAG: ketoacyl-ACP synthase III [Alphaproteobacteria bacterium]|nr:ketoacyl-ACP synthase III [Alphaproteobacteria bacterium]